MQKLVLVQLTLIHRPPSSCKASSALSRTTEQRLLASAPRLSWPSLCAVAPPEALTGADRILSGS